jgi:lysophospholipase L1-like esterase
VRQLTFSNATSTSIPAGATQTSDAVALDVPALSDLAVSLYLPDSSFGTSLHQDTMQTSYVFPNGNTAGLEDVANAAETSQWCFLEGVDVERSSRTKAVVAFGDSLTEGNLSSVDANARWPDQLARRLAATPNPLAVVNEGCGGNQVLRSSPIPFLNFGESALARFERDVLGNHGVSHVVLLAGTNDIGLSAAPADSIIGGLKQLVDKAHQAHLKIIGATLLAFEGADYWSPQGETVREAVNAWIRTAHAFDGIIDFDQILRDPMSPTKLRADYDSGDHLHLNDAGYTAMGDAVDLALLR